jgi:hypothetical protein
LRDISRPVGLLGVLRYTDYTPVVACGLGALASFRMSFSAAAHGQWAEFNGERHRSQFGPPYPECVLKP